MTASAMSDFDFDHIRLSEVDDSQKAIDQDVYTVEVNSLTPTTRTINKEGSEFQGRTVPVLQGSFTIVDNDKFASRKVWGDLWMCYKAGVVGAKKIQNATGVLQAEGQAISEWASQFATLNPPARIQVLVEKLGPEAAKPNRINFYSVKPVVA